MMFKYYWQKLKQEPMALTGGMVIILIGIVAVLAPFIMTYNPIDQDVVRRLMPPNAGHWLGADDLGRDVLSRMIYGARISLTVAIVAIGISTIVGTSVGLISGYCGGMVDAVLMRFVDILLCFPTIFLILMVVAFLEPDIKNVMAVIGLTSWMGLARLVRGEVLSLKSRDFILAAKGLGLSTWRILFVHLLPNAIAPILVSATLGVGSAILVESALSFLGLGVQPPTPSWGNMLTAGKDYIHMAWWLSLFPGLAILVSVLSINMLGEGLRSVMDVKKT